jgi:hypothetical protein
MHSTDRVLEEFQHPLIGDVAALGSNRMRLERLDSERALAWRSQDGNWVWTFVLTSENGSTRLISRNRFRLPTLGARVVMLPMEPASLLMERAMLAGISGEPNVWRSRHALSIPRAAGARARSRRPLDRWVWMRSVCGLLVFVHGGSPAGASFSELGFQLSRRGRLGCALDNERMTSCLQIPGLVEQRFDD